MATAARTRHLVTNWMATALMAEIATRWLIDGTASELVRWQRAALGERNDIAAQILGPYGISGTPNGLHVWLPLRLPWQENAFVALARHHGVAVAGGSAFAISDTTQYRGVRICLGSSDGRSFERGLHILARLAISEPEFAHLAY